MAPKVSRVKASSSGKTAKNGLVAKVAAATKRQGKEREAAAQQSLEVKEAELQAAKQALQEKEAEIAAAKQALAAKEEALAEQRADAMKEVQHEDGGNELPEKKYDHELPGRKYAEVEGFPRAAIIRATGKAAGADYITKRCTALDGKTVQEAMTTFQTANCFGQMVTYSLSDLRYDVKAGRLELSNGSTPPRPVATPARAAAKASAKADKASPSKTVKSHPLRPLGVKKDQLKAKQSAVKAKKAKKSPMIEPEADGKPLPVEKWPAGVRVDTGPRVYWLPDDWGQGVKTTCKTFLRAFISPKGKMYYHKPVIEQIVGRKLGAGEGIEGARTWARDQLAEMKDWKGRVPKFDEDEKLFEGLSPEERAQLPEVEDFHFGVISARRAGDREGIRRMIGVQAQLLASGATPRWYVDEPSLEEYRNIGVDAVVGGKLVPARNACLEEAAKQNKIAVELSDDIREWAVYTGVKGKFSLQTGEANEASKKAVKLRVSPVAAARFLTAKMRAAKVDGKRPYLAGVYPLGNLGQAYATEEVTDQNFILGDFFVHDRGSPVRFDERFILKEDYDFTCQHLEAHGSVLRCNRMLLGVVHESNAGGACSERDTSGDRERKMIQFLEEKWPGVFRVNPHRGDTQVVMNWRWRKQPQAVSAS